MVEAIAKCRELRPLQRPQKPEEPTNTAACHLRTGGPNLHDLRTIGQASACGVELIAVPISIMEQEGRRMGRPAPRPCGESAQPPAAVAAQPVIHALIDAIVSFGISPASGIWAPLPPTPRWVLVSFRNR